MGGRGERFRTDGYSEPKPLIPIQGRPMLARTLSSLPRMDKALALAEPSLSQRTDLAPLLSPSAAKSNVIRLSGATRDAIETCLHARAQVDPDLPVLVAACDAAFVFDETAWKKIASDPRVDFAVWTFRNHPHANRNPKQYSWARTDAAGNVLDVAIKESLHPDPRADAGLTGTFYFRRAADFFSACETLKQALNPTGREQHLDWVIRVLTANGKHGCVFDVTHFICFGTPDDLRTFDYWAKYFLETRPRTTSEPRRKTG
jgi:NDP-sugar pyrophosphorylase family protein